MKSVLCVSLALLLLALAPAAFSATWTGGMLYSRFGVTLDTQEYDFDPGAGEKIVNRFVNSWTPLLDPNWEAGVDVSYIVNDFYGYPSAGPVYLGTYGDDDTSGNLAGSPTTPGTVTEPSGGEVFDVEAIYMTNDERAIYIAILTSNPPPPGVPIDFDADEVPDITIMTGDLAIHTEEEVGLHSGDYAYGVDINHADEGENDYTADTTIGTELYKTDFDGFDAETDDWYTANTEFAVRNTNGEETNFYGQGLPSGQFVGDYDDGIRVKYINTNLLEGYEPGTSDPYASTWEINIILPISLFPEYAEMDYGEQRTFGVSFIPGCRNDGNDQQICLRLEHEFTGVPEPGTFVMAGLGLIGLALLKRRRSAEDGK